MYDYGNYADFVLVKATFSGDGLSLYLTCL